MKGILAFLCSTMYKHKYVCQLCTLLETPESVFRRSLKSTNPEAKLDIEHHTYSTVDYSTMSNVRSE